MRRRPGMQPVRAGTPRTNPSTSPASSDGTGALPSSTKGVACAASRRWPLATASYHQTAERVGERRGKKIARVEVARRLTEAIRHVLTRNRPFVPAGRPGFLAA